MTSSHKHNVFISYSPANAPEVEALVRYLADAGVRVWFDKWELVPGASWDVAIHEALRQASAVLICIGATGLGRHQLREAETALEVEVGSARQKAVIPILLRGADQSVLPSSWQTRGWVDLRQGLQEEARVVPLIAAIKSINTQGKPLSLAELERPSGQRMLATSYASIGDRYRVIGKTTLAETAYLKAQSILEKLVSADPNNVLWQRDLSVI